MSEGVADRARMRIPDERSALVEPASDAVASLDTGSVGDGRTGSKRVIRVLLALAAMTGSFLWLRRHATIGRQSPPTPPPDK